MFVERYYQIAQVESWVGKFVGIVTAGAVGVTTLTYSVGTGSSTKLAATKR